MVDSLENIIASCRSDHKPCFLLFTADWCGDCRRTEPGVTDAFKDFECQLIKVPVERDNWRDAAHPYRKDARLKLSGIPSLVYVEKNAAKSVLYKKLGSELENSPSSDAAEQLVKQFIDECLTK